MNDVPPGQAGRHDLHRPNEQRRLPVALGTEAVAVGHEALGSDARELDEVAEVLEGVREGSEAAGLKERPQADLDPGGLAERRPALAVAPQRRRHVVGRVVLVDEPVDVGIGRRAHGGDEVADAVAVDPDAEADLRLDLVAFGDGDLAHVVPEAGETEPLELVDAAAARAQTPIRSMTSGSRQWPTTVVRLRRSRLST